MGPHYVIAGRLWSAVGRGMTEPTRAAVESIQAGLQALHGIGIHVINAPILSGLSEIALALSDAELAARVLNTAISSAEESGEKFWSAECYRLAARVALAGPAADPTLAAERLARAIEIAAEQEAVALELRATIDLVEQRNRPGDAALLQPLLAAIEGGGGSADVRRARQLIAQDRAQA